MVFGVKFGAKKETPQQAILRLFKKFGEHERECNNTINRLSGMLNKLLESRNEREYKDRLTSFGIINNVSSLNLGYLRNSLFALQDLAKHMTAEEGQVYKKLIKVAEILGEKRKGIIDKFKEVERRRGAL